MSLVSVVTPLKATHPDSVVWAKECIESVLAQSVKDWEMVVVDDESTVDISALRPLFKDPRIRGAKAGKRGVSEARNQAAGLAQSPLLLPLDADDKLTPNAIERFLWAWDNGGSNEGIVYTDVLMFDPNYQRLYGPPKYNFTTLLKHTFMTVGCLHRKSDWQRSGGWRPELMYGLEDWEYWITLGELGVCGFHLPEALYLYRRHQQGRLSLLKGDTPKYKIAYQILRDLHKDTYNGRWPEMCCGDSPVASSRPVVPAPIPEGSIGDNVVRVMYLGARRGGFSIRGRATGTLYNVQGPNLPIVQARNGRPQVDYRDAQVLVMVNRGADFRIEVI